MDRETARQKSAQLEAAVTKAYDDLTNRKITAAEFDRVCDSAERENERISTMFKSRQRANQFAGSDSPGEYPQGWASGVQTKGSPPSLALEGAQMKAMYDKACSRESFAVHTKDILGFNSAIGQLPPELAPYVTRAIHERRLMDRLPTTACTAPSYEIVRHVSTSGAAAVVAEGAAKPTITLGLDHVTLPMVKLACNSALTWETVSDYDRFCTYLSMEAPLQVVDVENQQLLYGTGTSGAYPGMTGFYNTPSILTHVAPGLADYTALDAVEESIEQLRSGPALAEPDLFVISPSSWSALRRVKDTLNRYLLSPDPTSAEAMSLWGVPVLVTTQCNPGDAFLLDTSKLGHVIVREGITVRQGYAEDDFICNVLRFVWEERLNLGVERPSAVLYLSNLPTTSGPPWAS